MIDPESRDTLTALVRRAAGVRLLVLAAYRPLGTRTPTWHTPAGRVVRLDGLDSACAVALVTSVDPVAPVAPVALAEQLRVHTGGSPLYMRALLQEHPTQELVVLAARGELPAPADLAATLHARVAVLAPDAAQLLNALAVLGDAWADLPTAAAIGGVRDADTAVALLRDEGLLRLDRTTVVPRIRIAHAVICAAVYEVIPTSARRRLHGAAAARLAEPGARLRHRFAATLDPDEGLATDLEHHADQLHGRAFFREAARFRLLAASATAADAQRLRHPRRRRAVQPHRHRRADQDPAVRDRRRRRPVLQRPARRAGRAGARQHLRPVHADRGGQLPLPTPGPRAHRAAHVRLARRPDRVTSGRRLFARISRVRGVRRSRGSVRPPRLGAGC